MDVLRENIGLLQLPYEDEYLNEFNLPFRKKSRREQLKDFLDRHKDPINKIGTGLFGIGALTLAHKMYKQDKAKKKAKL